VPKIIINNTINLFFQTAISILLISNHNNFRVLFDKIASMYLTLEIARTGNQSCANCMAHFRSLFLKPILHGVVKKFGYLQK